MRTFLLAALAAIALSTAAQATELDVRKIPYERIGEERSAPGESLDAFVLRIGPKLRAYSDATRHEACGVLAKDDNSYGIVIGTSGSHLACAIFMNKVPEGMTSLRVGIHSHGGKEQFRANKSDRLFMGLGDDARTISRAVVYGQELNMFSETDHHIGEGYLATETGVLHYDGAGNTREVRVPVGLAVK